MKTADGIHNLAESSAATELLLRVAHDPSRLKMPFGGLNGADFLWLIALPAIALGLLQFHECRRPERVVGEGSSLRMIPVALSLLGTGVQPATTLFLGWFGPRGIASILYTLLILEAANFPGREAIFAVMALTVLLSIIAHGVTATPLAALYGRAMGEADGDMPEHMPVEPMPVRHGARPDPSPEN